MTRLLPVIMRMQIWFLADDYKVVVLSSYCITSDDWYGYRYAFDYEYGDCDDPNTVVGVFKTNSWKRKQDYPYVHDSGLSLHCVSVCLLHKVVHRLINWMMMVEYWASDSWTKFTIYTTMQMLRWLEMMNCFSGNGPKEFGCMLCNQEKSEGYGGLWRSNLVRCLGHLCGEPCLSLSCFRQMDSETGKASFPWVKVEGLHAQIFVHISYTYIFMGLISGPTKIIRTAHLF